MTLHANMAIPYLQLCPWNRILINRKGFFSVSFPLLLISKKWPSHFRRETSKETQQHWYHIHTWSETALKGTFVNRDMPYLHWESLEIKLTVPLRQVFYKMTLKSIYSWDLNIKNFKVLNTSKIYQIKWVNCIIFMHLNSKFSNIYSIFV